MIDKSGEWLVDTKLSLDCCLLLHMEGARSKG